jgi:hypothetical protein
VATVLVTPLAEEVGDIWDHAAESDAGRADRLLDLVRLTKPRRK